MEPHEFCRTRFTSPGHFLVIDEGTGGDCWNIDLHDVAEGDQRIFEHWVESEEADMPRSIEELARKYVSPYCDCPHIESVAFRTGYGARLDDDLAWEVFETGDEALAFLKGHVDLDAEPRLPDAPKDTDTSAEGEVPETGDDPPPIATRHVTTLRVVDPDSQMEVEVEIRKLATGPMVGIDGSWLERDEGPTYSPYDRAVELEIPDDEEVHRAKRPASAAGRLGLARDVFDTLFREFESFREENVGSYLAYLLGAIVDDASQDSFVQLFADAADDADFLAALRRVFPPDHRVWLYIEIDTDEECPMP